MAESAPPLLCRSCRRPRGENLADGTRCESCGKKHALVCWLVGGIGALNWSIYLGLSLANAVTAAMVTIVVLPPAFLVALLVHEGVHVGVARALGFTVSRVVLGEGREIWRIGRDPHIAFGSVLIGNSLAAVLDLRRRGYRGRWALVLLAAPVASLLLGAAIGRTGLDWPLVARVAAIVSASANLVIGILTLIPVPTFGGRVWSDLSATLFLMRASEAQIAEHMILAVQDRAAHLLAIEDQAGAVAAARAGVAAQPTSTLARNLLAYVLLRAGRTDEMRAIAAETLAGDIDAGSRTYLSRLLEEAAGEKALA